jgi:hypothetical protein
VWIDDRTVGLACRAAIRVDVVVLAVVALSLAAAAPARDAPAVPSPVQESAVLTLRASGSFEVKLAPQAPDGKHEGTTLGRMSLEKQYHGDLEATARGEMLTAMTGVKGSGSYVAIERVKGALHGRSGSFVLQHIGTMTRGEPQLSISVVPDSGAGRLVGIAGRMTITIAEGKHSYQLTYTLPETP